MTFIELVEEYRQDVFQYILAFVNGNKTKADDIFQNTMERAQKGFNKLVNHNDLKGWLFTIAKNEFMSAIKKESKLYNRENAAMRNNEADNLQNVSVDDFTVNKIDNLILQGAADQLNDRMKQLIYLHNFCDISLKEIAAATNENYNSVKSRYKRALNRLREILIQEEY